MTQTAGHARVSTRIGSIAESATLAVDAKAKALHQPFMEQIVANFDNEWELTSSDIDEAVRALS